MAIYLNKSATLILTAPKTGGTWLREALTCAGVAWVEEGPESSQGQGGLEVHGREHAFVATFVRHPVDWYRSYWAYRMEGGWRPRFPIDQHCASGNFTHFVRNVVGKLPGFLSAMFSRYAGELEQPVDFVGLQEQLADDLATLLTLRGETFDEHRLRQTPHVNVTKLRPAFGKDVVDAICVSEQEALERFDYSWEDPLGLSEVQQRYAADKGALRRLVLWTERSHWLADDPKRAAGDHTVDCVRAARCRSNYALYAALVKGEPGLAQHYFEQALELAPSHPRTLANYAAFRADELADLAGADALFRRALSSRKNHRHTLDLYSKFLSQTGRPLKAFALQEQLALLPAAPSPLLWDTTIAAEALS